MDLYKKVFEVFKSTEHYDFNEIKWEEEKQEDDIFLRPVLDKHSYGKIGTFLKKQVYTGEEHFVKQITNPLYYLSHRRLTIVVTKKDGKVTLKYFVYHRIKDVGKTYYKVGTSCHYYTYNYKKNLLYLFSARRDSSFIMNFFLRLIILIRIKNYFFSLIKFNNILN